MNNISGGDPSKEEISFELLVYNFQMASTCRSWRKIKGNRNQSLTKQIRNQNSARETSIWYL